MGKKKELKAIGESGNLCKLYKVKTSSPQNRNPHVFLFKGGDDYAMIEFRDEEDRDQVYRDQDYLY